MHLHYMIIIGLVVTSLPACNESRAANSTAESTTKRKGIPTPQANTAVDTQTNFNPRLLRRFQPMPEFVQPDNRAVTQAQIELGRMLYYDTRLSKNHDISCNSCHDLKNYGVDSEPTSAGHKGRRGTRNAPSTYNAAALFLQLWDGRADDVEAQAVMPITNPDEMAMYDPQRVVAVINSIPGYREMFENAFPGDADAITFKNLGTAIGAFERGLVTPSRWDRYLKGDHNAVTPAEINGLKVFTNIGCMVCHTGELVGGSMFEKVGVVEPWPNQSDQGRYEVTKSMADRMMFKVPSLRNIEKTAPYFHDGSVITLPEAVRTMGFHQLGLELSDEEIDAIVVWLKSLTGELPLDYIKKPELPPSSTSTPAPDPS